jgi:hypothetical protein
MHHNLCDPLASFHADRMRENQNLIILIEEADNGIMKAMTTINNKRKNPM